MKNIDNKFTNDHQIFTFPEAPGNKSISENVADQSMFISITAMLYLKFTRL